MAIAFEELKGLVSAEGLRYFVDPERSVLLLGFQGMFGTYEATIAAQDAGQFVQMRTIRYLNCPANHPHLTEVLKVLAHVSYQKRLVKLAWDQTDGEIVAYADVWLMEDGRLTQKQLARMLGAFVPTIDVAFKRLSETLRTGKDPGEIDPAEFLSSLLGGGGLPGPSGPDKPKAPILTEI